MRAIIKPGRMPGVEYVTDAPMPVPKDDEILMKVKATAICGTDLGYWKWSEAGARFGDAFGAHYPFTLGHECCGEVVGKGANVENLEIGDRVAIETHIFCGECYHCKKGDAHNCQKLSIYGTSCDGCFAEYATAPAKCAFKVSDKISDEQAALYEPAGVAMFGLQEADVKEGDTVMVYGCGPIGQMAIMLALARGAKNVIAIDIVDLRVQQANELGAIGVNSMTQNVGDVVREYCAERGGVDVIIEVSGASAVYDSMADYLRKEGTIVLLAHPAGKVEIDIMKLMHHSGATIKGCFGRRIWGAWTELNELVESGKVDLTKVITHRFPLSAGNDAFEQIMKGSGKVIFLPELEG